MTEAFSYIKSMLGFSDIPLASQEFIYYFKEYAVILVVGIIDATPLVKTIFNKLSAVKGVKNVISILEPVALILLLVLVTAYLVDGSFNPFLYFRF
jgi:alginate O-acetyltransferase complex protein AlgI